MNSHVPTQCRVRVLNQGRQDIYHRGAPICKMITGPPPGQEEPTTAAPLPCSVDMQDLSRGGCEGVKRGNTSHTISSGFVLKGYGGIYPMFPGIRGKVQPWIAVSNKPAISTPQYTCSVSLSAVVSVVRVLNLTQICHSKACRG